ncbi:MAG: GAF domain-containing protein [Chloroflexi bacterium]|nr:GAF domain-containing protein [Chloroflexota bacterium]
MKAAVPFRSSVRVRVVLGVTILLILILGLGAQFQYTVHRETMLANLEATSTWIGESVERTLTRAMLSRDRAQLEQVAQDLAVGDTIRNAMILNHKGVVRIAARSAELDSSIPATDPTCLNCHRSNDRTSSQSFVFTTPDGARVFRNVTPILNRAACQSCHDTAERVNGILVIDLPIEALEAHLRADLEQNLVIAAVTIVLIAMIILLLLDHIVLAKLDDFRAALLRYARGDFAARVPVTARDEIGNLARAVNHMAQGLEEKEKLEQEVQRTARQLERESASLGALYRVALESSRSLNVDDVLRAGLENARAAAAMASGEIYLTEPATHTLRLRAAVGAPSDFLPVAELLCQGECLCGTVVAQAKPSVANDLRLGPSGTCGPCRLFGFRAAAAIPLCARGRTLGVIFLHDTSPREFSADDRALLNALGDQLGVAIDNALLYTEMESRVQALSRQVQHLAVLEERDRLAREMHDGFAQTLALLHLKLSVAQAASRTTGEFANALAEVRGIVDQTFEEARQLIGDLRTPLPQPTNFVGSLSEYVNTFALRYNLQAEVCADADAMHTCCSPDVEIQVMRIVQETMANVRKHARAAHVRVEFARQNGTLNIQIQDDGQGFDPAAIARTTGHFGLAIMRERAASFGGELHIRGEPGVGTTIQLRVPVAQQPRER